MKASNFAASLALLFALAGVVKAQDGGLRPADDKGNTPVVTGNGPAPSSDPVAPPPNTPQAPATSDTPTVEGQGKDQGGWKTNTPPPAQAGVPEADPLAPRAQ